MNLFRSVSRWVPRWLADRGPEALSVGFKLVAIPALLVDAAIDVALQGANAATTRGTPSALAPIGAARGVVRGRRDTDEQYAAKLRGWIDRAKATGSQRQIGQEVFDYLGDCRVRIVNRAGHWYTFNLDGTVEEAAATWDWDSVSHPERAGFWSELFVVVYTTDAFRPGTLGALSGEDGFALGHMIPRVQVDALKQVLHAKRGPHSMVRAVIFTTDAAAFDPTDAGTCPDGTWGAWGTTGSGPRVKSGREYGACRVWEPR